jgi:flagellar basal-body rod protein FlgB
MNYLSARRIASSGRAFTSTQQFGTTDTVGMSVTPSQFDLLAKLVDVTTLRHKVLSQNVANVNVPGYRKLNVSFDEALAQHVRQHGEQGIQDLQPQIVEDPNAPARLDGNTVDIDGEMMRLSKNTLLNNTYLQILSTKTAMMRRAIDGR